MKKKMQLLIVQVMVVLRNYCRSSNTSLNHSEFPPLVWQYLTLGFWGNESESFLKMYSLVNNKNVHKFTLSLEGPLLVLLPVVAFFLQHMISGHFMSLTKRSLQPNAFHFKQQDYNIQCHSIQKTIIANIKVTRTNMFHI